MEQACRRAGLKFGVYCSPWDRNNAAYATPEYVKTYHAQVEELNDGRYGEIFEMWFDGANGGDGYYGGAWEKRSIGKARDYYQFGKLWDRVRELQPKVCFFGGRDGFTWPGNESGVVPPESGGTRDDGTFQIYEADFPLRPGWFYHKSQDGYSRSGEFLMKIYLRTVGNGAVMDIGIAPDRRGRLTDEDAECLRRFSEIRKKFFSKPVADVSSPFNVIQMKEDVRHGERVDEWRVLLDGREVAKGGKIGTKRIRVLDAPVSGKELKLEIVKGDAKADEIKVELFAADEGLVRKVMASEEPKRPPATFELKGVLTSRKPGELVYMMKNPATVSSLVVSPDAESPGGTPVAFRLAYSVDGANWSEDETEYRLDNVAANPVPQDVALAKSVKVKYLRLRSVRTLGEGAAAHLKGIEFVPCSVPPVKCPLPGDWKLDPEVSDEFNAEGLDNAKWWDYAPHFPGRPGTYRTDGDSPF
jgi:alpha-L-fucosidase